jgi:hypothetical protein
MPAEEAKCLLPAREGARVMEATTDRKVGFCCAGRRWRRLLHGGSEEAALDAVEDGAEGEGSCPRIRARHCRLVRLWPNKSRAQLIYPHPEWTDGPHPTESEEDDAAFPFLFLCFCCRPNSAPLSTHHGHGHSSLRRYRHRHLRPANAARHVLPAAVDEIGLPPPRPRRRPASAAA